MFRMNKMNEVFAYFARVFMHGNDAQKLMKHRSRGGIFDRFMVLKINKRNGSSIPNRAKIGRNAVFPHGLTGVFISSGASIGDNCVIFHQVTIGSNTLADSKSFGAPVIGNNVYIGCGAKIIGSVHVGDNVRIGANCVVTTDIPDNATVVMHKPAIILHAEGRDNSFQKYKIK